MSDREPIAKATLAASSWQAARWPEAPGPALALMCLFLESTAGTPDRIAGAAACDVLNAAIEGRVRFGPDDFAFMHSRSKYMGNAEDALRKAVTARNHSAATSIERSFGRRPWWHEDGRLDPAPVTNGRRPRRRRLYLGAELFVIWNGGERRARVTSFVADEAVRLKIGPTNDRIPDDGFSLVTWSRETLKANTPLREGASM